MTKPELPTEKQVQSEVKKLRGWLLSDESQQGPLVDALNELTALRLLAHSYTEAVEDAQEAMNEAHRLVMSHGAVGPYTPAEDAGRFLTSMTHVAATQVGLGMPEAGGQTAAAAFAWMQQLPLLDLAAEFAPRTAVWLLATVAEDALAGGDAHRAGAYADAARLRAEEGEVDERLASDVADLMARVRATGAHWQPLSDADALASSTREPVAAEPEPVEPEPVAPEPVTPEPVPVPEPVAPAPVTEPEPVPVAEPEVVPEPTPTPEDPVLALHARADEALARFNELRAAGDRAGTLAASEEVVALVRQLAEANEALYGPTLVNALRDLSDARRRGGDWWGSRGPAKEARQLAKRLGI